MMKYLLTLLPYLLAIVGSGLIAVAVINLDLTSAITGTLYIIAGYLFLAAKRSKK